MIKFTGKIGLIIITTGILICLSLCQKTLSRQKRLLVWNLPGNTRKIQLITGFGVPVPDLKQETVIVSMVVKANYLVPYNTSDIRDTPILVKKKRKRSISRWALYDILAQLSEMKGFGGRPCVLRTICELSDSPLSKNNGLWDEIIHTLFSPTSTLESLDNHADNEYYAAQKIGKFNRNSCRETFPDCTQSYAAMFTSKLPL